MTHKPHLKKRILATIIDYTVFLIPAFLYIFHFGQPNDEGGTTVSGIMALPVPIGWLLYFVVIEASYGATIAHQVLYLKVTINKGDIGWRHALKRHLLDPVDFFFYGIPAIIAIKNTAMRQRLGDMWAQTIVVDTRDPEQVDQLVREK